MLIKQWVIRFFHWYPQHIVVYRTINQTLKYICLWNEENVPEWRKEDYYALKALDLKTSKACAIKDNFRYLCNYKYEACMRKYFDKWYFWTTHKQPQ